MKPDATQYLFLQKDYDDLVAFLKRIRTEITQIESQVGFSTSQSSETYHDNIMHEELMRKYLMEEARYDRYRAIQVRAKIIEPAASTKQVAIGHTVEVERDDLTYTYKIGSYMLLDPADGEIAYSSPLGTLLAGAKAGSTVTGEIGGRPASYRIMNISA